MKVRRPAGNKGCVKSQCCAAGRRDRKTGERAEQARRMRVIRKREGVVLWAPENRKTRVLGPFGEGDGG